MPKNDETRDPQSKPSPAKPLVAAPPPKRRTALLVATVTLVVWLLILTSLAIYSVWG